MRRYASPVADPVKIASSILAADFSRLGEQVAAVADHVDMIHIDVMDGHFVPNISVGLPVIRSLRPVTTIPFDCHLMITNPEFYLDRLKEAGADMVTVHIEAHPDPTSVAAEAARLGLGFGLAVNPPTPFAAIEPFLDLCSLVLVMTVQPGFGGQSFISEVLGKVEAAQTAINIAGLDTVIQVDGGIDPATIAEARAAGADVFVAGSAIFRTEDPVAAVAELRNAATRAALHPGHGGE